MTVIDVIVNHQTSDHIRHMKNMLYGACLVGAMYLLLSCKSYYMLAIGIAMWAPVIASDRVCASLPSTVYYLRPVEHFQFVRRPLEVA